MSTPFSIGSVVQFSYPADNRFGVRTKLTPRRFLVESVRDTELAPIEPWALTLRPDLRRGRVLVTGYDFDRLAPRSFYVSSARSIQPLEIAVKRFALYDPFDGLPVLWIGAPWEESKKDPRKIKAAIERFHDKTIDVRKVILSLGVFDYSPSVIQSPAQLAGQVPYFS